MTSEQKEGRVKMNIQGSAKSAKRWALGCEKILPCPAWLLLSKTGPPFSPYLYIMWTERAGTQIPTSCGRHIWMPLGENAASLFLYEWPKERADDGHQNRGVAAVVTNRSAPVPKCGPGRTDDGPGSVPFRSGSSSFHFSNAEHNPGPRTAEGRNHLDTSS